MVKEFAFRSNRRRSTAHTASVFRLLRVPASARTIFSICVVIFLVPLANGVLAQSDATKQKIESLLGLYDVAVTSEQWLGLDADAGALLEAIASDPRQLPSRRMRAFEGMVALRTANANDLLVQAAHAETEPRAVRMAAIRGLSRMLTGARLLAELRPILAKASDAQLRGVAAEVLAQDPAGRAAVLRQARKETPAWRTRFLTGAGAERSMAPSPPRPPISPDAAAPAPKDSPTEPQGVPAPSDAAVGPTETIDLGIINVVSTALSVPVTVTVPQNAISIDFVGVAVSDPTARVVVYHLDSPSGRVYDYASSSSSLMKVQAPAQPGGFSVIVPNTPTVPLGPGAWTIELLATKPTTVSVKVLLKRSPTPSPTLGTINLNLFFVGVPGLSASSAQSDANFQAVINVIRTVYSQVGVTIGSLSYIDVTGSAATMYGDLNESDLGALMRLSNLPGAQANAASIFFVHTITGGVLQGYTILGESAGLPGVPIPGSPQSGLAVAMSDFPAGQVNIGFVCSHELGHWLGLFHTTESGGTTFDPLPDTAQCSAGTYDVNHDGIVTATECSGVDGSNLMFWATDASVSLGLMTPNQGFVMLRHPLVATSAPYPLAISSITYPASNTIHLQCVGVPFAVNRIESSPDLRANSFTTLTSISVDGTGVFQYDDTNAGTQRFYRVAYP